MTRVYFVDYFFSPLTLSLFSCSAQDFEGTIPRVLEMLQRSRCAQSQQATGEERIE